MGNDVKFWKPIDGNVKLEWLNEITSETIIWCEKFGHFLADEFERDSTNGKLLAQFNDRNKKKDDDGQFYRTGNKILSTSQLRKFFGELRRIENENKLNFKKLEDDFTDTDLLLLKPKLAYQVGREKEQNAKIKNFYSQVSLLIDGVKTHKNFTNMIKIVEAIVAYHKEVEPKKNN